MTLAKLASLLLIMAFIAACEQKNEAPVEKGAEKKEKETGETEQVVPEIADGMLIHLTKGYDNPHHVLMALNMAQMMCDTVPVAAYLDIEAVKLVMKNSEDLQYKHFPPLKEILKNLIEKDVKIMACPGCIKAAGLSPDSLMDGVMTAKKEVFFNFTKGRVITLDY